jgi:hypothetical protein
MFKLHVLVFYQKTQVKFWFGHAQMVFDSFAPLAWKEIIKFTIFKQYLVYKIAAKD